MSSCNLFKIYLYNSDIKSGILGLTFELMDCNLYELISKKNQFIPEPRAKNLFFQIYKAMEYMHRYPYHFQFIQ